MTRPPHARATGAARLLGVLALMLGMLAMHGLVSGHHNAAAATLPQHATTAVAAAHSSVHSGGHAAVPAIWHDTQAADQAPGTALSAAALVAAPGAVLQQVGASFSPDCTDCTDHEMAMLCLAVLSAGLSLLTLLLARRARLGGLLAAPKRLPLLRAGPPLRLRPPDLVSQLCVSRT